MAASKANSGASSKGSEPSSDKAERAYSEEAAKLSYEVALERLEAIIERVERGEIGLEESLAEYRRGRALLQRCQSILDVAEQEVRRMTLAESESLAANLPSGTEPEQNPRARGDR